MTKTINIAGREFPVRMTLGVYRKFDNKFKSEGMSVLKMGDVSQLRTEHIVQLVFYGIEAGAKSEGEKLDINIEWIYDNVDVSELGELMSAMGVDDDAQKKT
jgi:hypothetical protein